MKKILIVLTNMTQYGEDQEKTGLWLAEATEFIEEVTKAGFVVDYVSPKGGEVPLDPRSLKKFYVSKGDEVILKSQNFKERALNNSLKPEDINSDEYVAVYYTGGHGVIWDYPENEELQKISMDIYQNGGYISSVCHGVAGLLNLKLDNGEYFIKDKEMTGFTQLEEILSGKHKKVIFSTEKECRGRGAKFKKALPFTPHVECVALLVKA